MTRPIADIVIHFGGSADDDPAGGTKVREALRRVLELCEGDEVGNEAYHQLYDRLGQLYDEIEETPAIGDDIINEYVAELEEFWRILDSYEEMTVVERLLNLTNVAKSIEDVHNAVRKLFSKIGLEESDLDGWEELHATNTTRVRGELEGIVRGAGSLFYALHDVNAQLNALVLINAEIDKMDGPQSESKLPETTQSAIRRAQRTLQTYLLTDHSVHETPAWFVSEADVTYKRRSGVRGSFSSVHFGKLRGHTDVVVKILESDASNVDVRGAFVKEASILFMIRHPYIVSMFGGNHASRYPFIVMERATNGSMVDYLERSPLNILQRWRLLYQAAQGLEYLHSKKITHADLKLNNILISGDGKALIADFGLSVIKNRSKSLTKSTTWLNTSDGEVAYGGLRWRAPEQNEFQPRKESDVYSYAMCILEAFLGEPPYGSDTDAEAKDKILRGELPPRPEGLHDEAWLLIQKMTTRDPRARIPMAVVVGYLKRFADDELAFVMGRSPVCGACGAVWDSDWSECQHCENAVVKPDQTVTIESEETLRQTVSSLTEGTPAQREQALVALSEYAHGSSHNQDAIISTRVVPLLLKLLEDESSGVRLGAVTTLSAIASMNTSAQDAVAHGRGLEPLLNAISQGSDELLERGLMALCVLVDNNSACQDAARAAGAIPLLLYLSSRVDGRLKTGADMALKLLQVHYANRTTPSCVKLTFLEPPSIDDHNEKLGSLSIGAREAMSIPETSELDTSKVISQFVNLVDEEEPLLYWALQNMDLGLVTYLAANGADVNFIDKEGQPLIHVAVQLRSAKALECLVTYGADINATNKAGETVLHIAAATRSVKLVSFLTSRKAKPNILDKDGSSPLHNCLFSTPTAFDYDLESAYSVAFALCDHGVVWDRLCEQRWQDARAQVVKSKEASNQVALGQVGLGACVQQWLGQRSQNDQEKLREIPIEVVKNGENSVATYIAKIMATTAAQEVYRRRICVVGHTTFGKTSLVNSIVKNKPCCVKEEEGRTVGIDRIHMSFIERDGETARRRHDVTFWDYAGQSVYQAAHSVFFSKRTLYLLCVDLHEYAKKLNETLPPDEHFKMMDRYLSDHVFRWARLVLMRHPDAQFLIVGTKRDQVQGDEDRIRYDFKRRLKIWVSRFLEDAKTGINTGTIRDSTTIEMLEASLNRMQRETSWLTVSTLNAEDVSLARSEIERIIINTANERSFKMPAEYTQVLSAIHDMHTSTQGVAADERLAYAIRRSDALLMDLDLSDDESCRVILRTLRDLGDVLWFEQEGPEILRNYTIIDPTIVIDVVREVVNHNRVEEPASEASVALRQHGKLEHAELMKSVLWGSMDADLLLAFKQLLQFFQLAYPADCAMDWNSHLIVPAFRKSNTNFGFRPLIKQQSSLRRGGFPTNSFVRWDYDVSDEISDTLFDQFAVESYNDEWKQIRAGPDCVQAKLRQDAGKDYTFQVSIDRGSHLTDTIRLEVLAEEYDICWRYVKWFVLKMQYVLQGYPGLKPLCRVFDPQAGVPDTGIALANVCEQAPQLHRSMSLPSLSWYKLATRDEIRDELATMKGELDGSISDVATEADRLDALTNVVVTQTNLIMDLVATRIECEFPSLWIFKYNAEAKLGEVRILSDVSGICHHSPFEIKIPDGYLAEYESWIKGGVTVLSTVADCFLGMELLKSAMNTAKSAITNRVDHAVKVHGVIEKMDSPDTEGYTSSRRPEEAVQLLRALLLLHDEQFDDRKISSLSGLQPFADKPEGRYKWASKDEINKKGKDAIPCNPRLFEIQPLSPTVSASAVSTATSTASSKPHTELRIESVTGFSWWDRYNMHCRWEVRDVKRKDPLVARGTTEQSTTGKSPTWTKVFTIEKVASLEQLRDCMLHVSIDRPSRIPQLANKTLAQATLKFEDHIQVGKMRSESVRIENFPLDKETPPRRSITLSITFPALVASSGA